MRNSWKGLVIGGLTGASVGILIDAFAKAVQQAAHGAEYARDHADEAAEWLHHVTQRANKWALDAEVPDRVRHVAQRIVESDLASRLGETASKVAESTVERASKVAESTVERASKVAESTIERARSMGHGG